MTSDLRDALVRYIQGPEEHWHTVVSDITQMLSDYSPEDRAEGLDVERLARAIETATSNHNDQCWWRLAGAGEGARILAAEYARLTPDRTQCDV